MSAEELRVCPEFRLLRRGRFLFAELLVSHVVLSTSARNGGQRTGLRFLLNHQSCEGGDHRERMAYMAELGQEGYHDAACREAGVDPRHTAMMGTAANMNYAALVAKHDGDVSVTAVVTAGVQGNAACAGDAARWRETASGWEKVAPYPGTINTILLISHPLTEGALARSVVTMTEAKSSALQRLAVRSLYSADMATGTGTDQYIVAAAMKDSKPFSSTSTHVKLGELTGQAVREATLESLRWQNGLEPSYTRGIFHALGCHGVKEATFLADIAPLLSDREAELLRHNDKAVFHEPLVGAAAHAMAAVLDRVRCGTLPGSAANEAVRQQAANLAASLASRPECWSEFHGKLTAAGAADPKPLILAAIALGWSARWR